MRVLVGEDSFHERTALHSPNGAVYELRRNLKKAMYGCVYLGVELDLIHTSPLVYSHCPSFPKKVAIKVVEKRRLFTAAATGSQEDPLKEISVAQYLEDDAHPNLMGQLESISDNTHYYIVMNFSGGGELFDVLDSMHHFSEPQARHYFSQILAGLSHLHSNGVCHRDLSLENALVSEDGLICQIIDFGMSLRFAVNEDGVVLPFPPLGACGKRYYMAPEVFANEAPFSGPLADVWSLGVVLFIMVVGAPPVEFASRGDERFCTLAAGGMRAMVASWGVSNVSEAAFDLLEKILRVDPAERLSLADIRAHPWMQVPH